MNKEIVMHASRESNEQTERRLRRVMARAELKVYEPAYCFEEFTDEGFPARANPEALALVRDGRVWSQLVRAEDAGGESFKIFGFHFAEGLDNSGFVGWLASHLKRRVGRGVFVVCGQNSARGGIFDYWGCPVEVADPVLKEIRSLRGEGREESSIAAL